MTDVRPRDGADSPAEDGAHLPCVSDPARLAALRALCLEDGRADAAFDRLTRLAARFVNAPAALVNLVESDRQITRSAFGPPHRFRRGDVAPLDDSICKFTIENGAVVNIADTHADPRSANTAAVMQGSAAYAGVPLVLASGHAVGTLCVLDDEARVWTPQDIEVLSELAAAATTELELIAVTQAAEARAAAEANSRRLNAVLSITDVALARATLEDTLASILERLREVLSSDTATILLIDEGGRLAVRASVGLEIEVEQRVSMRIGEGLAGRIAQTREPLIVTDVSAARAASPYLAEHVKSLLGAPLLLEGELLGVVHVGTHARRAFGEDDVRLLVLAASRLAAALERARHFDAERALRKAAEDASRAKSEFLAVMSHELRTPLNIIGGHAELLVDNMRGELTPPQHNSVSRIQVAQRQLAGVIDDILQHVALDLGPANAERRPVNVHEAIERARASLTDRIAAKDIDFQWTGCPDLPRAFLSAEVLDDILARVLDNAIKFSPKAGVVTVDSAADSSHVRVCVTDSGPGIPEDRIDSIFEPFGRLDSSYRRGHEGIGLGLTIARARAREMGGNITVRNVSGRGAEFQLELPRA